MIFPATQLDRNYAFFYAKEKGYKYYYENMATAGTATLHYISKDEYGCILGYFAFHLENNSVVNIDMISYEKNKILFKDFKETIKKIITIVEAFYLELNIKSPAYNLSKNLFKSYNGSFNTVGESCYFMWIKGG